MDMRAWNRRVNKRHAERPLATGLVAALMIYPLLVLVVWLAPTDGNPFLDAVGGSVFAGLVTAGTGFGRRRMEAQDSRPPDH